MNERSMDVSSDNAAPVPPPLARPLSANQRNALLTLLADEDLAVCEAARRRLLEEGPQIESWLRPHTLSDDPVLRRRTREILRHFATAAANDRMQSFCSQSSEDLDLEEGALLLARTRYPELNLDAYRAVLDEWAGQVTEWLAEHPADADAALAALHTVLFQRLGFHGNETNYYDPDNSYLNRVIDRRTGNPLGLCALSLLIGRRAGLPLTGIALPAHFVCRYQTPTREVYFDAFHGGRLLSRTDCIAFVNQLGRPFEPAFLHPVGARRMLQRMCTNLEHAYENLELRDELVRVRRYQRLLGRT